MRRKKAVKKNVDFFAKKSSWYAKNISFILSWRWLMDWCRFVVYCFVF